MAEHVIPMHGWARPFYEALRPPQSFTKQDRARNWLAILSTNEFLDPRLATEVRASPAAPNGYVVGAGLGNIFSMLDLYPEGQPPKGIVCTDVMPEVVLVGRAFIKSLKKSDSMEETVGRLKGVGSVPLYASVIHEEKNPELRKRFVSASPYVVEWMQMAPSTSGAALDAIRRHFSVLKGLAQGDSMAMTYASLTDPSWITYVQELPGWPDLRNVVYGSNVVDHATRRGLRTEEIMTVNAAYAQLAGGVEKNWFADTTDYRLQYDLRIRQQPPVYGRNDFMR